MTEASARTPEPQPADAWRSLAPTIFELVAAVEQRATQSVDPAILTPVRAAVASVLGPDGRPDIAPPGGDTTSTPSPATVAACVAFAEQFVVDVAGTTDDQRAALTDAMGRDTFTFVQVLYVTDVFGRMWIGLDRLAAAAPEPSPASPIDEVPGPAGTGAADDGDDLWTLLERFMQLVAQRDALDPLTAELVRLHGARVHDCRLCRSRLSVRALDAAGDRSVFDREGPDDADLDERHRVALRLTDALVTQPSSIDGDLAAAVVAHWSADEVVEIVLDVARNAANKIAVALGADAPVVTDGTEFYDLDATGEVVADADVAIVRAATAR